MGKDRSLRRRSFRKRVEFRSLYGAIYGCILLAVVCDSFAYLVWDDLYAILWYLAKWIVIGLGFLLPLRALVGSSFRIGPEWLSRRKRVPDCENCSEGSLQIQLVDQRPRPIILLAHLLLTTSVLALPMITMAWNSVAAVFVEDPGTTKWRLIEEIMAEGLSRPAALRGIERTMMFEEFDALTEAQAEVIARVLPLKPKNGVYSTGDVLGRGSAYPGQAFFFCFFVFSGMVGMLLMEQKVVRACTDCGSITT
jgi:hypothetical protein